MSPTDQMTHDHANAPAAHQAHSPIGEEAVLEVLQEFQTGLDGLRALYQQRMAMSARLAEREAELDREFNRLRAAEQELKKSHADVESLNQAVEKSRQEVERSRQEVESARRSLDESRIELDRFTGELAARDTELRQAQDAVAARQKTLEAASSQLAQREHALADRAAEQEALRTRVMESERTCAEARAALAAQQARAADQEVVLRRDFEEAMRAREETLRSIASGEPDQGLRAELEAARVRLAALESAAHDHARALADERAEKERLAQALGAAQAAPAKGSEADRARLDSLRGELEAAKHRMAALESRAQERARALTEERASNERLTQALATAQEAAAKGGGDGSQAQALRAELDAARKRVDALEAGAHEHARILAEERAEKQRLAEALAAAQSAPQSKGSENERARMEKAAKAIAELRHERDALSTQSHRLKKELDAARKAGAAAAKATGRNDAALELRRSRLKRYRRLVAEQSKKVLKATETLKSRFEHAEKLMAQRQQLAEANEKIKIAQRRIESERSKAKAAALVFYAISSALVLATMSWMITGWIAPGTYVASAVISAQGRGRALNAAELGEWQTFHQQLVNDPRFHEVAAERMGRRALTDLASAGAVREMVATNVNTRSAEDGELVIELRGEGPDRTARILETFTTALASHANASRQQRVDGAVTSIKQAALAGTRPIDSTRYIWAGGLWIASMFFAGCVGWMVWKRLNSAKISFEKTANVDELLDEAKWVTPTVATQMRRDRRMLP